MNGALNMGDDRITGVLNPSSMQDISTKIYADNNIWALKVMKTGDVMSNNIDMNINKITHLGDPVNVQDVVTKMI